MYYIYMCVCVCVCVCVYLCVCACVCTSLLTTTFPIWRWTDRGRFLSLAANAALLTDTCGEGARFDAASAYTPAYVSIRQHTSAYVSIPHTCGEGARFDAASAYIMYNI